MAENSRPFQSFSFTLLENRRPRASLRMSAEEGGLYELQVQKGSAANPSSQFTRQVPLEVAVRLRDAMQSVGVFGWEESYGDATAPGSRKWALSIVFEEGVFTHESKGGSDVPSGFGDLLEELYRLDFPRPVEMQAPGSSSFRSMGALPASNAGSPAQASGVSGIDLAQASGLLKGVGLPGLDASEVQRLLADPQAFQRRMKEEFLHLPPDGQNRLLDALAATGLASRAWWERFFRG